MNPLRQAARWAPVACLLIGLTTQAGQHTTRTYFDTVPAAPYAPKPDFVHPAWTGSLFGIRWCTTPQDRYQDFLRQYAIAQARYQADLAALDWQAKVNYEAAQKGSILDHLGPCNCGKKCRTVGGEPGPTIPNGRSPLGGLFRKCGSCGGHGCGSCGGYGLTADGSAGCATCGNMQAAAPVAGPVSEGLTLHTANKMGAGHNCPGCGGVGCALCMGGQAGQAGQATVASPAASAPMMGPVSEASVAAYKANCNKCGHGYGSWGHCNGNGHGLFRKFHPDAGVQTVPNSWGPTGSNYPPMNREDAVRYLEGMQYYPPLQLIRSPRDFFMFETKYGYGR